MDPIRADGGQVPPILLRRLGFAVVAIYLGLLLWAYADGAREAAQGGRPLFTDFTPQYGAALLLRAEPAAHLYIPERMVFWAREAAQAAYDRGLTPEQAARVGFSPWMYPPVFILVTQPLGELRYLPALAAWLLLTGGLYLLAARCIVGARWGMLLALAAPPAFFNAMYGQTGFLVAGLIGLGLSQIWQRPVLAGVCLGLACFKPHFGLFLPLALVAGGHWKPFGVATLTVVGLVLASLFAYGPDPWYALFGTLEHHWRSFDRGLLDGRAMTTPLALVHHLGADVETARRLQLWFAGGLALLVAWVWRRGGEESDLLALRAAVLCCATLLAVPLAYLYDLPLLVMAGLFLAQDMVRHGARRGEVLWLGAALAATLLLKKTLFWSPPPLGAVLVALVLALALQRLMRRLAPLPAVSVR